MNYFFILSGQSNFVGFSVYVSRQNIYSAEDVIKFDGDILSQGNYYNSTTGHFTCPLTGVYYMTFSLLKYDHPIKIGIKHRGEIILHGEGKGTVTNSRLVHCVEGQQMSMIASDRGGLWGHLSKYTTLSVMLMERDTQGKNKQTNLYDCLFCQKGLASYLEVKCVCR